LLPVRHETDEKGKDVFVCLICEKQGVKRELWWEPWEIPRHLEKAHGIPRKASSLREQLIPKWNETFEKEYLKNLYREIVFEKEPSVTMDSTPSSEYEKEKERIKKNLDAQRNHW